MTDPSTYQGVLVRSSLQDQGAIPRASANGWTASPDIILAGLQTPVDPQATYAAASVYGQDFGGVIVAQNAANYIYIRGKNLTAAAVNASAYLFYSPSAIVLNPQQWTMPQYQIPGAGQTYRPDGSLSPWPLPVSANSIAVNPTPFVWLNPPTPPSGEHFCLITMVGTPDQLDAQYTAATLVNTWADLGSWVLDNGGVGWRNVTTTDAGAADFSVQTSWANPGGAATVLLQLYCKNLPCGSQVAFNATVNAADGTPVTLAKTTVPTPPGLNPGDPNPGFSAGSLPFKIQQGYSSPFYYQWYGNGFAKPTDFSLTLVATVISSGDDALSQNSRARTVGEMMEADNLMIHHPRHGLIPGVEAFAGLGEQLGPPHPVDQNAAIIGSHTTLRSS